METITYLQAKEYFQKHQTHWEAICKGLQQLREDEVANIKRNINTPNCVDREYLNAVSIGRMTAIDDILYEFRQDDSQPQVDAAKEPNE